jgi:putative transposase
MTNIRRYFSEGQTVFLTHITYQRRPILIEHYDLVKQSLETLQARDSLSLKAWVVMPDHIHMIVENDGRDISDLMKRFKLSFSLRYRRRTGVKGRVWQYRFWDRIIRDEAELNHHIDYIHHNPVGQGLCGSPFEWEYSSAWEYLKQGYYAADWGLSGSLKFEGDFGE